MLRYISTSLIVFLMTFNAMAQNATMKKNALSDTLKKYEYMLTAAPNAGSEEAKIAVEALKADIADIAKNASKEELQEEFNKMIRQIPSAEKREAYKSLLENSSKAKLEKMMSNPQFLADSFKGEGANFTSSDDLFSTFLYVTIGALVLFAIIAAIDNAVDHQYYYSSTISFYEYGAFAICTRSDLTYDEEEFMINNALDKCERRANNPQTCRFAYFDIDEYVYVDDFGYDEVECRFQAVVKADR